jgi:hypothetical protein
MSLLWTWIEQVNSTRLASRTHGEETGSPLITGSVGLHYILDKE